MSLDKDEAVDRWSKADLRQKPRRMVPRPRAVIGFCWPIIMLCRNGIPRMTSRLLAGLAQSPMPLNNSFPHLWWRDGAASADAKGAEIS
jgi:hypothetical protein